MTPLTQRTAFSATQNRDKMKRIELAMHSQQPPVRRIRLEVLIMILRICCGNCLFGSTISLKCEGDFLLLRVYLYDFKKGVQNRSLPAKRNKRNRLYGGSIVLSKEWKP